MAHHPPLAGRPSRRRAGRAAARGTHRRSGTARPVPTRIPRLGGLRSDEPLTPAAGDIRTVARWESLGLPLSAQSAFDQRDGRARVVDLEDEAGVTLIGEFDHDGLRRIFDVPEHLLAV